MATVIEVIENTDGTATVQMDFTPEELRLLLTYAVTNGIRNGIKLNEKGVLDESSFD